MSASVSSERAFSQGGITTSKQQNWLNGDIVEMLQCIKCSLCHDLLFYEPGPSSIMEELDDSEIETEAGKKLGVDVTDDEEGWDDLILEKEDDNAFEFEMKLDLD
jgi:hypothetical protein